MMPSLEDESFSDLWAPDTTFEHRSDGDVMQLLFGAPDRPPEMATIHLHQFLDDGAGAAPSPPPLSPLGWGGGGHGHDGGGGGAQRGGGPGAQGHGGGGAAHADGAAEGYGVQPQAQHSVLPDLPGRGGGSGGGGAPPQAHYAQFASGAHQPSPPPQGGHAPQPQAHAAGLGMGGMGKGAWALPPLPRQQQQQQHAGGGHINGKGPEQVPGGSGGIAAGVDGTAVGMVKSEAARHCGEESEAGAK
jgi:hypothetical protein